jgi:capsular exopolysaccharide synthesis family protein
MLVRRGKKKRRAAGRARRHVVRPEPKIHEEDTAVRAPVQAKAHAAPKSRRKAATSATPRADSPKPAKPGRGTVALPVADGTAVTSLFAEAYRTLRTNLDITTLDGHGKCIIVTSPGPQEGKTCIAINLAIAAANVGLKVLLLEGDLRRARLHRVLLLDARPGLVNFLANGTTINGHIKETHIHNLWLLPRGSRPANPAELLHSETLADLLEELRSTYDLIVVDTPPLLSVADASVLSPLADGYLLVLRARKTPRDAAKKAIQQIEHVGGKVLGVVLNDVNPKEQRYRYYHRYAY